MTANRALWRTLYCLNHPLSAAAIVLLLVNDLWLRQQYPSWLTGKLGDVAWLVFAPFIAAVGLALIVPRRIRRREDVVGLSAFALVGLLFLLGKAVPAAHQFMADAWKWGLGSEAFTRLDPTDLLALPALMVTWWIWRRVPATLTFPRPLAYGIAAVGILATMGNMGYKFDSPCPPDPPRSSIDFPGYEYWLALTLAFLVITTSTAHVRCLITRVGSRALLLMLSWGSWLVLALLLRTTPPTFHTLCVSNPSQIASDAHAVRYGLISLALLVLLAIPMSIAAVWDILRNSRIPMLQPMLTAAGVGLLFLLPFKLWEWSGGTWAYEQVHLLALFCAGIGLLAAFLYLRRILPRLGGGRLEKERWK